MTTTPKWSTPNRQQKLVQLFLNSGGFCTLGYSPCMGEWVAATSVVCAYGMPCDKPQANQPCRFRCIAEENTPIPECHTTTLYTNRWRCGHNAKLPCYAPFDSHYQLAADRLIKEWQSEARQQASLEWLAEQRALHCLGETRQPLRGRFSNIARDIFHSSQPLFYLEAMGIDGLKLQPFAKVKIGSSYMRLYVELGDSLRGISKNRKRKAIRYGKPLPQAVQVRVAELVKLAVRDYLK